MTDKRFQLNEEIDALTYAERVLKSNNKAMNAKMVGRVRDRLEDELSKLPKPLPNKLGSVVVAGSAEIKYIRIGVNQWVMEPGSARRETTSIYADFQIETLPWKKVTE